MSEENNRNESQVENSNQPSYSFWAEQVAKSHPRENVEEAETVFVKTGERQEEQNSERIEPISESIQQTEPSSYEAEKGEESVIYQPIEPNIYGASSTNETREQPPHKQSHRGRRFGRALLGVVVGGTVLVGCFVGILYGYDRFLGGGRGISSLLHMEETPYIKATTVLEEPATFETNASKVYKKVLPSIVAIESTISQSVNIFGQTYENKDVGSGSGIIVGETQNELLIATNNHVVDGASKIDITFINGMKAEAITKGTDASADLAVVSIDLKNLSKDILDAIEVATRGDSDQLLEGEPAIAIGNALGYGQSITIGCISAVNRKVQLEDGEKVLIQTDAAINPGNSGGALINSKGEVIGINTVKLVTSSVEGMGYAIPITYANPILEELMSREIIKKEDQGYLGVLITEVTESMSESFDIPLGVVIKEAVDGGAAKKAGIQNGDIITGVEGVEVTTVSALQEKIKSYRYGTTVTITVQRLKNGAYEPVDIKVTLDRNPEYDKE